MSKAVFLAMTLVVTTTGVRAQEAEIYFHRGAQEFIGDELQSAAATVEAGLEVAPSDAQLLALKTLIEQEQEQQQQQQSQQNQSQQEENEQEQQDQEQGDSQTENEEQQEQEGDQQEQEPQPQEGQEPSQEEPQEQQDQQTPPDPDQLTREEAERILQALENEEEQLLREVQRIKTRPRRVDKDW